MSKANNSYPHHIMKYCPACGLKGFSPRDPRKFLKGANAPNSLVCSACGFEFFINASVSTAAVLFTKSGEILLMRRNRDPRKGSLDLPGGFVSPGEKIEAAVIREVYEETGLEVTDLQVANTTYCNEYIYGGITYFTTDVLFHCNVSNWKELKMQDPDEAEPVIMSLDMVKLEEIGLDSIRTMIDDLQQNRIFWAPLSEEYF